jgi:HEAT repeat protein
MPPAVPDSGLGPEEARAKELPEYAELEGFARPGGAKLSRAAAVAAVASHLGDDNRMVRVQAMHVLASMDARECVPDIQRLASSDYEGERRVAERVLEQFGHPGG